MDESEISRYVQAGYSILAVETKEEWRTVETLKVQIRADCPEVTFVDWDVLRGIVPEGGEANAEAIIPTAATAHLDGSNAERIVLFAHNMGRFWNENLQVLQNILNSSINWSNKGKCLIVIGPQIRVPLELQPVTTKVTYNLPSVETLRGVLDSLVKKNGLKVNAADKQLILSRGKGMTLKEFADAVALSAIRNNGKLSIKDIEEQKSQIVATSGSGALSVMSHGGDNDIDSVIGLDRLKSFIRRMASAKKMKRKGIFMVGPPGTGKSTIGKCIAGMMSLPCLEWKISNVKSKWQGESASNMRDDLNIIKAMAPCCVFVDEIDKIFTSHDTGASDGGTGKEMLGLLLSAMSDNEDVLFIGTANDVRSLPAPLIRAGRWNGLFFVDLPDEATKRGILEHYAKVHGVSLDQEIPPMNDWSGGEIEDMVEKAGTMDMTLVEAAEFVCPMATTMKDEIDSIRKWAKGKCVPASSPSTVASTAATEGRKLAIKS